MIPALTAGEPAPLVDTPAERVLVTASAAYLFLAPFAGSAGLRAGTILVALAALVFAQGWRSFLQLAAIPRAVLVAYAAWIALAAVSLAWSVQPRYTAAELRAEVLYSTLAFAAFFLAARDDRRWRTWCAALLAGSFMVLLTQTLQDHVLPYLAQHDMDGGPGPWSTHLVLVAPLVATLAWPRPWGWRKALALPAVAAMLLLAAAWVTENRMVWLAFIVQLAVATLLVARIPDMDAQRLRRLRRAAAIIAVVLAAAFGGQAFERHERLLDSAVVAKALAHDLRPRLWAIAWVEFQRSPWLGHGFGREIVAPVFLPVTPAAIRHPALRHAHNTLIDVALELGVAGLAVFGALLLALAGAYWKMLRVEALVPLGILGLALLAGFVVKNLTDDFFHRQNALVFWALNGMLLGFAQRVRR